ncbi:PREDICTED: F-box only protein 9-like [Amphimedon queenslandica]|uniref:F-box only protein 9 n=1 Tax=Amphimedon queenslandica TaxID=400682 RepID=A0A1X7VJ06_AMPQE|nr:PREDICTED: F-box only protein 9-like [Amphimedon queenslandica]|eukprot:XP_003384131.1 PREDICTED: F-box only protein 9-like [Amphimedon queenslandica]
MASKEQSTDTDELAEFREQWRAEIKEKTLADTHTDHLPQAEELYWMGVAAEENKDMSAAILYYRQAIQLVPDIERRATKKERDKDREKEEEEEQEEDEESKDLSVISHSLSTLSIDDVTCCHNDSPTTVTHISALPVEIIRYILLLIVINDLDLRSLEQFGMVCKRFYLFSREQLIWRKACVKLWGSGHSMLATPTSNWRHIFITQPHVHFNGVYISRSLYVRTGERSLDRLYKPFHTVVYYRYIRFFTDGSVLYMTSPDSPSMVVNKLNKINEVGGALLSGYYTQSNDTISIVVKRYDPSHEQSPRSYKRRGTPINAPTSHQRFHMELVLKNSCRKLSSALKWKKFTCHNIQNSTGRIQTSEYHIDHNYTPFYFSRVKSYSIINR